MDLESPRPRVDSSTARSRGRTPQLPTSEHASALASSPPLTGAACSRRLTWRRALGAALCVGFLLAMQHFGGYASGMFHWAESVVDSDSRAHMAMFVLLSLFFHIPSPVPLLMTAWCVAIGAFFQWHAFAMLTLSFGLGVPMSFSIGRALSTASSSAEVSDASGGSGSTSISSSSSSSSAGGSEERVAPTPCVERVLPEGAMAYTRSLRSAIAKQPTKLSFLLMWAPLPTSLCPFVVGFIAPAAELGFWAFYLGALPSKLLHFSCHVFVGVQAGSFVHGGDSRSARLIGIGTLVATIALIGIAVRVVHRELEASRRK